MIDIALETDTLMTGQVIVARVRWSSDAVKRIIVAAQWESEAFNGKTSRPARTVAYTPQPDQISGEFPVHLLIPHEGPISYKGRLIEIRWALWVRIDRRGLDEFTHRAFRVIPRKR